MKIKRTVISIFVGTIGIFLRGITIVFMWGWFIANTFNVQNITLLQAIGIDMLITFICPKPLRIKDNALKTTEEFIGDMFLLLLSPLIYLLFAWLVSLFM